MNAGRHLTVLGAGPAGLAAGYFAGLRQLPFTIYEAGPRVGGNAVTVRRGEFGYDSGAHRFHDKIPEVTAEITRLLGADLRRVEVPSAIHADGRYVAFPLAVGSLLGHLGIRGTLQAGLDLIGRRFAGPPSDGSLESLALHAYGRPIASRFLLNYSEKLWGLTPARLAASAAGSRLNALSASSLLRAALRGGAARHYEGAFLYPRQGIGRIAECLAAACGLQRIHTGARVTGLRHEAGRVVAVRINDDGWTSVERVISTLPVDRLVTMLEPAPPEAVLRAAGQVHYRNLVLVMLAVDQPTITPYATVYFPDRQVPFTRVSEPRNRSPELAPAGKTSLLVEWPCEATDAVWTASDPTVVRLVLDALEAIRWLRPGDVLDAHVVRLGYAYPVAELGLDDQLRIVWEHLAGFANLRVAGRNATFRYTWIHNLIADGKAAVEELAAP